METKILLIDDEARIRRTFARNLRMAGYTVLTAEHGAAGIAQYAEMGPDLVLLDLRMPDMDGLAVLQTIRERDPEANVILISGHGEKDAVIAALRAGASDFLPKPIDNVTLESALRRAEERIHLKRKLRASQEALRQHNARLEAEVQARTVELEREIEVRKQAHAALREREIKLRAVLDATTAAVVLLDREGIVLDANQAYVARFGLTLDELVGRCVWDLFPPGVTAYRQDRMAEVFASGEPVRAVDKREGMWNDYVIYPVSDTRGAITSVAVYAQDITERKQAEAALRESEARFRSYVDHAPHGIFISDETGLYLEVNPAACEISGYSEDELLQMHISELWLPEMHALAVQHFRHLLETGYASGEFAFLRKDSAVRYWLVDAVKLSPTRFMGFVRDTTERKEAVAALRASEQRFRKFFEQAQIGVAIVNPQGKIQEVNPFFCRWLGYSDHEFQCLTVEDITHPEDWKREFELIREMQAGERDVVRLEKRYIRKDGEIVWGDLVTNSVYDAQGAYLFGLGTVVDISERKRIEAALEASEKKYRELLTRDADESLAG